MAPGSNDPPGGEGPPAAPEPRDLVRERLRLKRFSPGAEAAYVGWIKRHIFFHGKRRPRRMGKAEVDAFLTSLAVELPVGAATQNQALSALLSSIRRCSASNSPGWTAPAGREDRPAGLTPYAASNRNSAFTAA